MNKNNKIINITEKDYEHLLKLKCYVRNWHPNYSKCKKCGAYNPIGYKCSECNNDNS